jgi:hypothetical protein
MSTLKTRVENALRTQNKEELIAITREYLGDEKANALQAVAYGSFSALITSGICVYILNELFEMMNLSEGDMMYEAINAIPGGVVTIVGVVILTCFIANISVALAIFGTSMPGSGAGGRF